jgi:hypothetical protein
MKYFLWIFTSAWICAGCTSTYTVTAIDTNIKQNRLSSNEFNKYIASQRVTVELRDKKTYKAKKLFAKGDSLSFTANDALYTFHQSEIQYIKNTYHVLGVCLGLGGGAFIGGLGGAAIGSIGRSNGEGQFWGSLGGVVIGTPIGALCGLVYGIVSPPETIYVFEIPQNKEQPSK